MGRENLQQAFGNIDIYLFDQLLKGRFDDCKKVGDIGCGYGRNLVYFLKNGFEVYGIDQNEEAILEVQRLSKEVQITNPISNFSVALVEDLPFDDDFFDLVICSAVLHFAKDTDHFNEMVRSIWRVMKPGGFLFARLASDIGIEHLVMNIGNGRFRLPDGSDRFLVNQQMLLNYTARLNAQLFEPIKTTNVQNVRCMTTWCIQKL
ncbi:class I SAM-dependent methyltransferase [Segetibacter sp.]|jgi:tellurite methyltransferase|uniref:class I SAM-dependent methyltransferase n=1 Tax=Segetibacter sp. TaxID=2231182 RepID=UPI00260C3C2B|nr:class I SAM-dependent methyltransferase [Segetibacter sp.]MCW3079077.1 methyltransferase protein [Segetibacter sp.]